MDDSSVTMSSFEDEMDLSVAKRLRLIEYSLDDLHRKLDDILSPKAAVEIKVTPKRQMVKPPIRGQRGKRCIVHLVEDKTREKMYKRIHKQGPVAREFLGTMETEIRAIIDNHQRVKHKLRMDYDVEDECYFFSEETVQEHNLPESLLDERWATNDVMFRLRFHSQCLSSKVFDTNVLQFDDPRDVVAVLRKIQDLYIEFCLRMDYMRPVRK
jgi:hypothetical protein